MYDAIIQKLIGNPRIDKKTLIQRFIAKIELESNISGNMMSSELSQIKNLINETDSQVQISMDNK